MNKPLITLPADYIDWLKNLKQRIRGARQRSILAASEDQIRLYHDIGREILERRNQEGWGAKVVSLGSNLLPNYLDFIRQFRNMRFIEYAISFYQKIIDVRAH